MYDKSPRMIPIAIVINGLYYTIRSTVGSVNFVDYVTDARFNKSLIFEYVHHECPRVQTDATFEIFKILGYI